MPGQALDTPASYEAYLRRGDRHEVEARERLAEVSKRSASSRRSNRDLKIESNEQVRATDIVTRDIRTENERLLTLAATARKVLEENRASNQELKARIAKNEAEAGEIEHAEKNPVECGGARWCGGPPEREAVAVLRGGRQP